MTPKAQKQLDTLNTKKMELQKELERLTANEVAGMYKGELYFKYYIKERNALYTKLCKKDEAISHLTEQGMTNAEYKKVCEEVFAGNPVVISMDTSLGSRSKKVAGYSTILQSYVVVTRDRYNGFMSNVKGCGSLANTTSYRLQVITEEQFAEIQKQPIQSSTFFGSTKLIERK